MKISKYYSDVVPQRSPVVLDSRGTRVQDSEVAYRYAESAEWYHGIQARFGSHLHMVPNSRFLLCYLGKFLGELPKIFQFQHLLFKMWISGITTLWALW